MTRPHPDGVRAEVELLVYHPGLDPERVTGMLGVVPAFRARAGEVRLGNATGRPIVSRTGTWICRRTGEEGESVQSVLERLLEEVEPGMCRVTREWWDARVVFSLRFPAPDPSGLARARERVGGLGDVQAWVGPGFTPFG